MNVLDPLARCAEKKGEKWGWRKTYLPLGGGLIIAGLTPVVAQPITSVPKQAATLSYPCMGCHPQANTGAIPSINGMTQHQFVRIMMSFQTGTRPATVMNRIAQGYTQPDFIKMAWFFSRQPKRH